MCHFDFFHFATNSTIIGDPIIITTAGVKIKSIANKTPIMDGDFVLVLMDQAGDENDIVLAELEDMLTNENYLTVKRYRKNKQTLESETTKTGPEYEPIHINENNAMIKGVVYAVAKPTRQRAL